MHGERRKRATGPSWGNLNERDYMKDLRVDVQMIVKF